MSLYHPSNSPYWHYDFQFQGVRYHASTKCFDREEAEKVELAQKQLVKAQWLDQTRQERNKVFQDAIETNEKHNHLLTPKEAAKLLGVSQRTLMKWVNDGTVPYIDFGRGSKYRYMRFEPTEILNFIKSRKSTTAGKIYFLGNGEFVKIGFAANVESRAISLQTASPYDLNVLLTIPGTLETERQYHERFAHLRHRPDREWFRKDPELLGFIAEEKAKRG